MSGIAIAGGYYHERCFEPAWEEWYGPGFRAAAALADRGSQINLYTYCVATERETLQFRCNGYGIECHAAVSDQPVAFSYLHWLSRPDIEPSDPRAAAPHEIDAPDVLCFGFYEGHSNVRAERCVYDPQSKKQVRDAIQSRHLIISCNYAEACALSGTAEGDPPVVAAAVAAKFNAEAVVVKGAWTGLFAWTPKHSELVPAIPTTRVHKIGSGDVCSAEFAYAWFTGNADVIEAARIAVARTANYCESATIPNSPSAPVVSFPLPPLPQTGVFDVYLAAPFFDIGQMSLVEELRKIFLEANLKVFSPYHDVGWGSPEKVATADIEGLKESKCVLACLGSPDVGTVFEIGLARARECPVIIYAPRLGQNDETMLLGSGCEIVRDFASAVYRTIWTCQQ